MFFIRSASRGDMQAAADLLSETMHAAYDSIMGEATVSDMLARDFSPQKLGEKLAAPNSEFVVADDGTKLGGIACAAMMEGKKDTALLHLLYVHPACHGAGLGRDLFAELETCFPAARILRVELLRDNAPAIRFYKSVGLAIVGETDMISHNRLAVPALIMEKPLAF